jgi:hypothetical protein
MNVSSPLTTVTVPASTSGAVPLSTIGSITINSNLHSNLSTHSITYPSRIHNSGTITSVGQGIPGMHPFITTTGQTTAWGNVSNVVQTDLRVVGDTEFHGDVKIKGKSLTDTLNKIEERLAIIHCNEALEEKWEELRNLRKAYMELEAEIIEKEKMWVILKR